MINRINKPFVINLTSILLILFSAFFATRGLVMFGALITSSFAYPLFNLPVILSGLVIYMLLMFYFYDAYIKFVSFKNRCIVLGISAFLSLVSLIFFGINITKFINNNAVVDIILMVVMLIALVLSTLSIIFTFKGKYTEDFFKETRYFNELKTRYFVYFIIFGILASYSLYAIFLQLITARNFVVHPLMYLLVLLALIMIISSFVTIIIDQKKKIPLIKVIITTLNFITLILLFVSEIIVSDIMVKVAHPICFVDLATGFPLLYILIFIDLIAKTTFLVITSLRK